MRAFAGEQRPGAADAGAVERAAVRLLAVAVGGVAVPERPLRQLDLQRVVDRPHGVDDMRVVRGAQAEAHQRQRIGRQHVLAGQKGAVRRPVLDQRLAVAGRGKVGREARGDTDVVARHAGDAAQVRVAGKGPLLDLFVPAIRRLAQVGGVVAASSGVEQVGGGQQCGDLDGEGEGAVAGILLPAVLRRGGAVHQHETGGAGDHAQIPVEAAVAEVAVAVEHLGEQDRKGDLVHLHAAPVGPSVEPHVLRPAARGGLGLAEVVEDVKRLARVADGEEPAGGLDQVARPDQVIAAEVAVALGEAPGDRQAGDDRAGAVDRPVRGEHRRGGAVGRGIGAVAVERVQPRLPASPTGDIGVPGAVEAGVEARAGALGGFDFGLAEGEGEDGAGLVVTDVDLAHERDVATIGAGVARGDLAGPGELLPAVGAADEPGRGRAPGP